MRGECCICGRWGTALLMIAPGKVRHDDCKPGSPLWREWYARLPDAMRQAINARSGYAAEILYQAKGGTPSKELDSDT
jgi:hypothetical protein